MNVIYIDQSTYHQQGLSSLLGDYIIDCYKDAGEAESLFNNPTGELQPVPFVIFDLPTHFLSAITQIEYLAYMKRKHGVTLIFFSDFKKNRVSYNPDRITADFFIDKNLPSQTILNVMNGIINTNKNVEPFSNPVNKALTENEIIFLCCLFANGSIEGVARVTRKNPKTLYSYQANLVKKLNLRNSLHLYKAFIHND
ncbi:LuxR family transcriptional regulator [Rahnella sp. PCH160]|uniref:LuxR family transcriptional regulator n=1 Tax=Rahnella sp. PCH160 TaxID=3447928 RepID=UPI0039FD370C